MDTIEELTRSARRLRAVQECRNLIGRFSFYNAGVCRKELCSLFAKSEGTVLESPWGIYEGYEGVWRRYVSEHGDRSDPEAREKFRGNTVIHGADTEIIEVADDCMSASGCWMSPGADFSVGEDGNGASAFCWIRIYADFVCEDGAWRIRRYGFTPLNRMATGDDWAKAPKIDFAAMYPNAHPDRPRERECWQLGEPYTGDDPLPPRPKAVFGEEADR